MSAKELIEKQSSTAVNFRKPVSEDGHWVAELVKRCPPLDTNSTYCNLLQCSHFAGTSVAAELGGELVGFVSGYVVPAKPDTLFVWQVAVDERARGMGLATRMIKSILARPELVGVRYIDTTITADNEASWTLFRRLAEKLNTSLKDTDMFDKDRHFNGLHDSERLVTIGPLKGQAT